MFSEGKNEKMTLMGTVLLIVLVLFIREEILSYGCRRELKRAEKEYHLDEKRRQTEEAEALLALRYGIPEGYLSSERGLLEEQERSFREVA